MPRGLVRYQQTGNFHFLIFSCYHRLPYLNTAGTRDLFEAALEQIRRRYNFLVAGYVVMPEHVHLLVSEPRRGSLARSVQALKLSVSSRRIERPFWQPRYYDFNVHNEEKRVEKLRYIHLNPVVRRLVAKTGRLALVQLPTLCQRSPGIRENRVTLDRRRTWRKIAGGIRIENGLKLIVSQVSKNRRPGAPRFRVGSALQS